MSTILYILLAIFIFGVLVMIHELGHFLMARAFGVGVNEFAIGMGPKIFSKSSKKTGTAYSVRALPIGGFCSMVGEDEESDRPEAFGNKKVWQRILIVCAGPLPAFFTAMRSISDFRLWSVRRRQLELKPEMKWKWISIPV